MKKILIVIGVVIALVLIYHFVIKDKSMRVSQEDLSKSDSFVGQRDAQAPSVDENGTYTIDKKSSYVKIIQTSGSSTKNLKMDIKSGALMVSKGNITGGDIMLSTDDLKTLSGLDLRSYPEAKLAIKAVVFERTKSTTENLVFRTDAELSLNGKTNPVSFDSQFVYSAGEYIITGSATPDWKLWGLTLAATESMSLDMSLHAVK